MKRVTIAAAGLVYLAGCSDEPASGGTPATFSTIAPDVFGMTLPTGITPEQVDEQAREQCGARQWCKVLGWSDASKVARAMPMTNRETAGLTYSLTINRTGGADESRFDCRRFKVEPSRCLSVPTEAALDEAS